MLNNATVSWDRKDTASIDSGGYAVLSSASGFPRNVIGNWQLRQRRARPESQGDSVQHHAVFYTNQFYDGKVGDRVTFDGVAHKVTNRVPRLHASGGGRAYAKYELERMEPGSDQV